METNILMETKTIEKRRFISIYIDKYLQKRN